jgi:phenylpyruvate tautomerase PptA (4-oxalocrotonate tautomerase family)
MTMPMLDAYIPDGALSPEAETKLLGRLTDLLLLHEGVDPANPAARDLAWVFLHRPEVLVGGSPPTEPRYRFVCQVPEGQYSEKRREAVTAAMTQAVADAEGGSYPDPPARVWVFTLEIPDGTWGGFGRVVRLPDIYEQVVGPEMRAAAEQRLATRHHKEAAALLELARTRPG